MQNKALTVIRYKPGQVPKSAGLKVKGIKDREYLNALIEKLINSGGYFGAFEEIEAFELSCH
ncbi:MAG: hypothetical protein QW733_07715 [Desulfurococcaceae archaeon]